MILLAIGCTLLPPDDAEFQDSFAPVSLFGPTSEPISSPYVEGVVFTFEVTHPRESDLSGWTPRSSAPWALRVDGWELDEDDSGILLVHVTAVGDGTAELRIADAAGQDRGALPVEVARPTHVELRARGPLVAEQPQLQPDGAFKVVQAGHAMHVVQYMDDERELAGYGALTVDADDGLGVEVQDRRMLFGEHNEYLEIAPMDQGVFTMDLIVDNNVIETKTITVVDADDLDSVEILGLDAEDSARRDDRISLLAVARDQDGDVVWGVPFIWHLDTDFLDGEGDVLQYVFDPRAARTVTAEVGSNTDRVAIQGGEVSVIDSSAVGCNGVPLAPALGTSLFALALAGVRRRVSTARRA
jgi:hypothetical protein